MVALGLGAILSQAAAPATPQGSITAKTFLNIGGGTAIADLTGNARFPHTPDAVAYPTYFELNASGDINTPAVDTADNYGAQIVGYFYPNVTGDYVFYLAADDNAVLYLSTDDTPANKKLIAQETGWSGIRSYMTVGAGTLESKNSSTFATTEWPTKDTVNGGATITLTQGRAYYIEALVKEGGGGDNLSVSLDGSLPIEGSYLSPFVTASGPVILSQPQDAYVYAGGTAAFAVGIDVPPPATLTSIKWQKNGVDIPNSNTNRLSIAAVAGDNGAKIKTIITTSTETLTSTEATLTVASFSNEFAVGVVKFEAYHDIGATTLVDDLLAAEKFPDQPDNVRLLGSVSTPSAYGDNYGARVTGFIIPPESGQYHFFLYSDDASRLFLSNNETAPDPNVATPICEETDCCDVFVEPGVLNDDGFTSATSEPVTLVGGNKYAFVALVKEGGGGDYLQVAARKVGDTTPAASLTPLAGAWIGANAKPNLGTPQITTQPVGIPQLLQGRSASLSIEASITPTALNFPVLVQWRKDGTAIPGANGLTYAFPAPSAADSGTYTAVVSSPSGETATSTDAVVVYVADTVAPKITKVKASTVSTLIVTFDEPIDTVTGGTVGNYSLSDGATISSATASGSAVLLNTGALTVGNTYTLTAGGVKDLYGNTVAAGTTVTFKVNVVTYADVILADGPIMYYRFEETTGQKTVNLGTAGAAADGLWMAGAGPDDSSPVNVSSGVGPRPGDFFGFSSDNRSGLFTGQEGQFWVDAQQQLI
ncbi:MAG: PA14 domain-containing protein, partial [Limisphaerales bacterium]